MTRRELNDAYFNWMYGLVCSGSKYLKRASYRKLLRYLHSVEFTYSIPMDGNRADDGTDLRYRFGYDHELEQPMIADYLDDRPCSVLEMMVALAIRCEEHIMEDTDVGNRTGQWFWNMIINLKLNDMTDTRFDKEKAEAIIETFLNREYKRNGEGGLFTVTGTARDMRCVDIWYQMCWYLDNILV